MPCLARDRLAWWISGGQGPLDFRHPAPVGGWPPPPVPGVPGIQNNVVELPELG